MSSPSAIMLKRRCGTGDSVVQWRTQLNTVSSTREPPPMPGRQHAASASAWYHGTRDAFLAASCDEIANQLAGRAADESLEIEAQQTEEWRQSVNLLQTHLAEKLPVLRAALSAPGNEAIRHVVLEYDFRRRGLRMDCILIADGALFVVEFKRTRLQKADRDQVMRYAVNLLEFHKVTREWCAAHAGIVVPVLALTDGQCRAPIEWPGLFDISWPSLARKPIECDRDSLGGALAIGLHEARDGAVLDAVRWLSSPFEPSSSILDATLSLYGNHDVSAISDHAAPKEAITASTEEVQQHIDWALSNGSNHIIFLSGAPGAGKTLVGLDIVLRGRHAADAVFVTGNAPLVDVLNRALKQSYQSSGRARETWAPTGYRHTHAHLVASAATFKIVKAHHFLGERGSVHNQLDGRVLVFDEAQRTYERGRMVNGQRLEDHEADLILRTQAAAFPTGGTVVVALVGHNQAINRGESGISAWLDAAVRLNWSYSVADATLSLAEIRDPERWSSHPSRRTLSHGHLSQSMRFYRNAVVEEWAGAVLANDSTRARSLSVEMASNEQVIWMTRSLADAREWARARSAVGESAGIIASGQARRLAAEGLFVDFKPDIATWMLAPSGDIRSSCALETVQNQYQIQGLELDYCIVGWDADLRRVSEDWGAFKLNGGGWTQDGLSEVSKNGYRVLLTRARKGMVIFVPSGDASERDETRSPALYDAIAEFLQSCGAVLLRVPGLH